MSNKLPRPTVLVSMCLQFVLYGPPGVKQQCQWNGGEGIRTHIARVCADNTVAATGAVHVAQGFHGHTAGPRVTLWHCTREMDAGGFKASRPSTAEATPQRIRLERETHKIGTRKKYFRLTSHSQILRL